MGPAGLGQREGEREGVKDMNTFLRFTYFKKKSGVAGIYGSTHKEKWERKG